MFAILDPGLVCPVRPGLLCIYRSAGAATRSLQQWRPTLGTTGVTQFSCVPSSLFRTGACRKVSQSDGEGFTRWKELLALLRLQHRYRLQTV
jgi:hypothetical protein